MSIALEFINLIVPITTIKKKYPGGFEQCLKDHAHLIGGPVWYDDYLFRDGAMSDYDMSNITYEWIMKGFEPGIDLCVIVPLEDPPNRYSCDWIELALNNRIAWLRGKEQGEVFHREKSSPC